MAQIVKNLLANRETQVRFRLGRYPGEGNGYPLQFSCLENSIDSEALWASSMGLQRAGHD